MRKPSKATPAPATARTAAPSAASASTADPQAYYQELFDSLEKAYWKATDDKARQQIQESRDAAYTILTAINQAQLDKDTSELEALTPVVTQTNDDLEKLQAGIDKIVSDIALAADVEDKIAKVLSLAGKLF